MVSRSYQASLELFRKLEDNLPSFSDVFDEETFYLFAFFVVVLTILVVFILSRFITLEECDW